MRISGAARAWRLGVAAVVVALGLATLTSCSPRKNNAMTRQYQAFITRYNIHFNGDTHYRETLHDMETTYQDDYSRLLLVHPAEARADEKLPQPTGDFNRSIEKAQKAIQLRSIKKKPRKKAGRASDPKYKAWLKRDEYNPFIHNSWLMMARSQYMNGDFLGAAATFFYISKHFSWLPNTVLEAQLWQARSYCALGWLFEAETILRRVKPDQLTSRTLKELYYTAQTDLLCRQQQYAEALEPLQQAIRYSSGIQKTRLRFLLGQLQSRLGNRQAAYQAFKKVGSSSSATYRTKFNARIKQSEVFQGSDIKPEVNALRRMVRYDRNKEYLDQIYYAIGNLYLSRADTAQAIVNYTLAAEKSTRNGIDKALAQLTLGGLYYDQHLYNKAQPCYAEALPQLPVTFPDYRKLKRRSDVLDELAVYSQNVELQDSLLRLSELSPEQQRHVADSLVAALKKKEKEDAEAAAIEEHRAQTQGQGLQDNRTQTFSLNNGDDSWYFYNTATKNAGRTEFQRRWGNRRLEDDWRRRNKASFSFNDFEADAKENGDDADIAETAEATAPSDSVAADTTAIARANDPHFPEYYLKQIPSTPEEKLTANEIVQEGLYNMGVILKDKLDDFSAADHEFQELLRRYPDNTYRLDVYYNLYLMFMRAGEPDRAEIYRHLILSDFPDSPYGLAMRDDDYVGSLRRMQALEGQLYDQAFSAYINNANDSVHQIYTKVHTEFPLSRMMPKFMFLEALASVTDNRPEQFKSTLTEMLERYPDTDLTPYASAWLAGLAKGRELQKGSGQNMRGLLWGTRLSTDSLDAASDSILDFDLNPDTTQLLIFLFPTDQISANALLYEVARHNFSSFVVRDFDLEQMNFGRLGLLIVRGFENLDQLNHYLQVLADSPTLHLPPEIRPVAISEANFDKLIKSGRSFDDYFQAIGDQTFDAVEDAVIQPEYYDIDDPQATAEPQSPPAPDAPPQSAKDAPTPTPKESNDVRLSPTESDPQSVPLPEQKNIPEKLPDYPDGSEGDDPLLN